MSAFYSVKPKPTTTFSAPKILKVIKPAAVTRVVSVKHWRSKMTQEQRTEQAAKWLDGKLLVLPTITLACVVFRTNYASIIAARSGRRGNKPHWNMWLGFLARAWMSCDEEQRASFACTFESDLWKSLERVTDVQHD
jgi:hypothetical protein